MSSIIQHERVQGILQNIPLLFKKFSPDDFRGFILTGQLETYQAGDMIISESEEEIEHGWLLADGELAIWKDDMVVARQNPGDFLGEEFLFRRGRRMADIRAVTDVALIRFERDPVLEFFRRKPERLFKIFIMNLLEIQQGRLKAMNAKVVKLQRELDELKADRKNEQGYS